MRCDIRLARQTLCPQEELLQQKPSRTETGLGRRTPGKGGAGQRNPQRIPLERTYEAPRLRCWDWWQTETVSCDRLVLCVYRLPTSTYLCEKASYFAFVHILCCSHPLRERYRYFQLYKTYLTYRKNEKSKIKGKLILDTTVCLSLPPPPLSLSLSFSYDYIHML